MALAGIAAMELAMQETLATPRSARPSASPSLRSRTRASSWPNARRC